MYVYWKGPFNIYEQKRLMEQNLFFLRLLLYFNILYILILSKDVCTLIKIINSKVFLNFDAIYESICIHNLKVISLLTTSFVGIYNITSLLLSNKLPQGSN